MFCQLGPLLALEELVAVGDALIYAPKYPHSFDDRPWLTHEELIQRVEMFRGRGKVTARRAVGLIRRRVESRMETLVRLAIADAGLPEPEVNGEILDPAGKKLGRADQGGVSAVSAAGGEPEVLPRRSRSVGPSRARRPQAAVGRR